MQTVFPLTNETGIKITTARYFTPSGRSIQAKGIEPDLVVEEPIKAFSGLQIREADLENHLNNPKKQSLHFFPFHCCKAEATDELNFGAPQDRDKYSIFHRVYVPLISLLCLSLPKSLGFIVVIL